MTNTGTGWMREFPKVDGVYWARRTHTNRPEPQAIRVWEYEGDWYAYRFGDGRDIEAEDFTKAFYEYLGPISPSDAEQLAELQEAARRALTWTEELMLAKPLSEQGDAVTASLRAALNPSHSQEGDTDES